MGVPARDPRNFAEIQDVEGVPDDFGGVPGHIIDHAG